MHTCIACQHACMHGCIHAVWSSMCNVLDMLSIIWLFFGFESHFESTMITTSTFRFVMHQLLVSMFSLGSRSLQSETWLVLETSRMIENQILLNGFQTTFLPSHNLRYPWKTSHFLFFVGKNLHFKCLDDFPLQYSITQWVSPSRRSTGRCHQAGLDSHHLAGNRKGCTVFMAM